MNDEILTINAYPKEETEEEPFISFTLENLSINYISTRT